MARQQDRQSTGAQVRGDIQSGRSGDKRPGFDPALAPLETDSEAGGAGIDNAAATQARGSQRVRDQQESEPSFNSAMRRFDGTGRHASPPWLWPLVIAAGVLAIGLAIMFILGTR